MFTEYQRDYKPHYFMGMTPDGAACGDGKVDDIRFLIPKYEMGTSSL